MKSQLVIQKFIVRGEYIAVRSSLLWIYLFHSLWDGKKILSSSPQEGEIFCTRNADDPASSTLTRRQLNYMDLLEYCFPCNLFAFTDYKCVRDEISVHLSKLAGTVVQSYRILKGRARQELNEKVKKVSVYEGQVKSVRELCEKIESLTGQMQEWKANGENLEEEKEKMCEELAGAINENKRVNDELELVEYASTLERALENTAYRGKEVSEIKNKTRTLKFFLSKVEMALLFAIFWAPARQPQCEGIQYWYGTLLTGFK